MKAKLYGKIISLILVIATLVTTLPLTAFAETVEIEKNNGLYVKNIKLAQAKTKEEAKTILEDEGYIFLDGNLNEGTDQDGIWMGYTTTEDPNEAIYDLKVMNMKGGFTLTSVEEALKKQETAFAQMAVDLNYLVEEFVAAYEEGDVSAVKAYNSLNFFRVVGGETELVEENGLGYQFVHGGISLSELTEMIMLCDSDIVDSVVKLLTTGIQLGNANWMEALSKKGPYDADTVYGEDEAEIKRRAEQILVVLQFYAEAYNAMDASGLIPDGFDDNGEPIYDNPGEGENIPAEQAEIKKLDESRYKLYKVVFDELAKYSYGESGDTLKDFFLSMATEGNAKKLYPLASVLSDGEFAALSYGCFIELANGVTATSADFDNYDEVYAEITKDVKSLYIYQGIDKALINDDSVIAFTDAASRHMATTGELEFFENETDAENAWETGKQVAKGVAALGTAVMGLCKITYGATMLIAGVSSTVASSVKSGMLAGVMKFCTLASGFYGTLFMIAAVLVVIGITYWIMSEFEEDDTEIDWENNPIPQYIYDVKEVSFSQTSANGGIATEKLRKPVFVFYEAVTDTDDKVVDLNAFSEDSSQWISLYASYDRQGDDAKPIKAKDLRLKKGNGETPSGYEPLTAFGQVIAYNLNQWDEKDDANGVYFFYKQDKNVAAESNVTYYIYDVYLQSGESDAHCLGLLHAAGYTPINVNLSPDLTDGAIVGEKKIYTYLGYKLTTNPNSAVRDLRIAYGPSQGEIKNGSSTYAECGSNGQVTLYATKYTSAGTPLLAGGLVCINDRDDAPRGYEPVNLFAGGPAVSVNATKYGGIIAGDTEYFLYFLPETTFTSGPSYLGGISYLYMHDQTISKVLTMDDITIADYLKEKTGISYPIWTAVERMRALLDYIEYRTGYDYWIDITEYDKDKEGYNDLDSVLLYKTHNPYRAIYDIKASGTAHSGASLNFESVGYRSWNLISWASNPLIDAGNFVGGNNLSGLDECVVYFSQASGANAPDMDETIYVSGNPSANNVHRGGGMSERQPLHIYDINCYDDSYEVDTKYYGLTPVTDVFTDAKEPLVFDNDDTDVNFSFYFKNAVDERPYVSNITAVDFFTLYRSINSKENVVNVTAIPEGMLLTQLANQGATNFCGEDVDTFMYHTVYMNGHPVLINKTKFGYTRTDKGSDALRDVFIYFDGITNDTPPKELYRGSVKYKLLCQIPYNLTPYDNAPELGIYLYGTTDSRAGSRIVNFEVSADPFKEGYETIRTMDGGSLIQEVYEYSKNYQDSTPFREAGYFFERIANIFTIHSNTNKRENVQFYLHVQRENSTPREEKPYIGKIYITTADNKDAAIDKLFDMGAEGFVDMNFNKSTLFGSNIYMGYGYTADPNEAIKDIVAYHEKNPPATLIDDSGRFFTLASDIDLNKGAGGDYIYLYTTKQGGSGPVVSLSAATDVSTGSYSTTWIDGSKKNVSVKCTKTWDSSSYSDLNDGAGGAYIYLMYGNISSNIFGSYTEPTYGNNKTYNRKEITGLSAEGKYIGALYVMDKNTIRQEKLAKGASSDSCTCAKITDQEVFDRLRSMGATTIVETPINVTGGAYNDNDNKVFIGYSRTDVLSKAIKNLAIKAEIFAYDEPAENIEVDKKTYKLVAEAASKVTELPSAINLIGLEDGHDMAYPRLYLYYSTSGTGDPIYDICIDADPIKNGWNTVRSSNKIDPYIDICNQVDDIYSKMAHGVANTIYSSQLSGWANGIKNYFDVEEEEVSSFYIHVKKFASKTIEEEKPYIGEIFLAYGDSEHEALTHLIASDPDGYIAIDLNHLAGGDYVYLGYKRVAKAKDALADLVIFEGKNPSLTRRININGTSVKYTLVDDIDLNKDAGGKYLYLYASDSTKTGNYITNLKVEYDPESFLKCGVELVTVKRAEGSVITNEQIDINKEAGGPYLYLIMERETTKGHNGHATGEVEEKLPTCGDEGYYTKHFICSDCNATYEETTITPATGKHSDADGDGNHKCDVCGKKNLTTHTRGEAKEENRKEATADTDGSYSIVYYCTECNSKLSESKVIIPAGTPAKGSDLGASVFSTGSIIAICSFAMIAIVTATVVYFVKKKKEEILNDEENV